MVIHAREAYERLRAAADSGALDAVCVALDVDVLGAFGSAIRPDGDANDLDVAVRFRNANRTLDLIDELTRLLDFDRVDVVVLTGDQPAIEAAALSGVGLYEAEPGSFAERQMAALAHARDTAWLRKLDIERLAG